MWLIICKNLNTITRDDEMESIKVEDWSCAFEMIRNSKIAPPLDFHWADGCQK
jgi:hypothetical protein